MVIIQKAIYCLLTKSAVILLIIIFLGPIGAPGDPLADPYDDPSYSFSFRTAEHQRREDADSAGRVRGKYQCGSRPVK